MKKVFAPYVLIIVDHDYDGRTERFNFQIIEDMEKELNKQLTSSTTKEVILAGYVQREYEIKSAEVTTKYTIEKC